MGTGHEASVTVYGKGLEGGGVLVIDWLIGESGPDGAAANTPTAGSRNEQKSDEDTDRGVNCQDTGIHLPEREAWSQWLTNV